MKNLTFLLFFLLLLSSCSNDESVDTPTYVGQYFLIKNYAVIDGVKGSENIHEGSCSGKSFYSINSDNNVSVEVWAAQSGKCSKVGAYTYTYDQNSQKINGENVKIEGNYLIITNMSTGTHTIENVYYYRK
ncbi:hypothetical protein ATE47_03940 [Chryseobacterium sp. IHB B 17019]|uniref:hypothetical protein n=1 Tax=Chryseobacterium sp. IHB B 17019 TaxID=1721091 RepID=UPI000722ED2B|nr:hypothetical protein [Chryseobacterium sp. IHB B 17019]ALR29722.1 hypothetical protein ATE47_03940 [Chryseobacterium sp. IHB B 17019]